MESINKGFIWSAIERFSVQGSQFILSLVIARLVTPADFGLIAMLSIFMAIAQVFTDSGFGNALIQKKDRNPIDYSTVFYFNIGVSIVLYLILFFGAPLIAKFYNEPELMRITRVVGLNLILMALCLIQKTIYRIELNFKMIAKVSLFAMLASGVLGIYLAYIGYGVWALVFQTLSNNLLLAIIFWLTTKWKPLIEFSIDSFKKLFSFGSKLLLSHLLHTIFLNLYTLVIGKFYNPTDVGYYNRAYTISQYPPVNLITVITNVVYPLQCKHQDNMSWIINTFPIFLKLASYVIFPLMLLLAVISKPLVMIILSEKWIAIAPLISILAFAYMWITVGTLNNTLLNSSGRSDLYLKGEIIKKIVAILILIVTIPFGLFWLCVGLVVYNLLDIFIIIWFTRKIYPTLGYITQFKAIFSILILSVIAGGLSYLISIWIENNAILLILQVAIFISIYLLGSVLGKFQELTLIREKLLHNRK